MHGMVNLDTPPDDLRIEYAYYTDDTDTCGSTDPFNFPMVPEPEPLDSQNIPLSYEVSNLLRNNDFFLFDHPGGTLVVTLNYKTPSAVEADLDLIIYKNSGPFGFSDGVVGSASTEPGAGVGNVEKEVATMGNLPAGHYLINVYAYRGIGNATSFELLINISGAGDKNLCPIAIP